MKTQDYGQALLALRQQLAELTDWMLSQGLPPVTIAHTFSDLASAVLAERVRHYRYQQRKNGR